MKEKYEAIRSRWPTTQRINELINCHGGVVQAIQNRERVIARRADEGKASLYAEAELDALRGLGAGVKFGISA